MCGIAGAYNRTGLSEAEAYTAKYLGILTNTRGTHSSGLIAGHAIEGGGTGVAYWKRTKTLTELLFADQNVLRFFDEKGKNPRFMIMHARHATVGHINRENAHPHHSGSIVGVHNGTVGNFSKKDDPTHSDSRQLYERIAAVGLEEAVKEAGDGAMALAYIDMAEGRKRFNLFRNSKRPLFVGENYNGTIFFASEEWMLTQAAKAPGTSYIQTVRQVPVDTVLSFSYKTGDKYIQALGKEEVCLTIPFVQKKKEKQHQHSRQQQSQHTHLLPSVRQQVEEQLSQRVLGRHGGTSSSVNGSKYRCYGCDHELDTATKLLEKGCAYCGKVSDVRDVVWWCDYESHLCVDCYGDKDVRDLCGSTRFKKGELL